MKEYSDLYSYCYIVPPDERRGRRIFLSPAAPTGGQDTARHLQWSTGVGS